MIKNLYIFVLFITSWAFAQNPNFYSQVSKTKVAVGEVFQVAFTLEGQGSNLTYPNFKDFDIYSGPNQSQSMSMVNGNFSQSTTISLFIAAKKEGKFTIGPATVMAGGQKLETKPIIIEAVKTTQQQQQQQQQQQAGNPNSQGQQTIPQGKNQSATEISGDDLFVRTLLSKTKSYLGEQLTLTQKVYSRVDLRGFQNVKFPQYNGFWSQAEEGNKQINLQQENVNGVMYYVAEYHKMYLFPQQAGKLTVEPIELECIVRRQTKRQPRNIFEQFFGTGGYEDFVVKVKSKAVKVEVIELPQENKPENFTGAVGNFSYKAEVSKDQIKANDAFNLKITITGKGNIKLVDPLKLNLPESFEVYDPKISENVKTSGGVSGSKTYDYLIIPREEGEFTLSDLNFSYFDTEKKQYVSLPSPDIKLTILPGDGNSAKIITPSKREVNESENDIRYIKTGDLGLTKNETDFFSSLMHYLLLVIPTILFIISVIIIKQRQKANNNIFAVKERKAAKIAKKQLITAEKHMKANQKDEFFSEILNAIHKYLENKFGLATADMSKEKISEMLISKQVTETTTKQIIDTIGTCEYAKYAPSAVTGDLHKVYHDTAELISQIEEQIKK